MRKIEYTKLTCEVTERLVTGVQKGSQTAAEELYDNYRSMVEGIGSKRDYVRVLGEEDALQEANLAFMEAVHKFDADANHVPFGESPYATFAGFLVTSITNHMIDVCIKEKRRQQTVEFCEEYLAPLESFEDEVADKMETARYGRVLRLMLTKPGFMVQRAGLTVYESVIVCKIFMEEYNIRDLAYLTGLPKTTVSNYKVSALKKLRRFLLAQG